MGAGEKEPLVAFYTAVCYPDFTDSSPPLNHFPINSVFNVNTVATFCEFIFVHYLQLTCHSRFP